MAMLKTIVSSKGQVVIPKQARDQLSLTTGMILKVQIEGKRVILEPLQELPKDAFIQAGSSITEPVMREAKASSDKARNLLRDIGVSID